MSTTSPSSNPLDLGHVNLAKPGKIEEIKKVVVIQDPFLTRHPHLAAVKHELETGHVKVRVLTFPPGMNLKGELAACQDCGWSCESVVGLFGLYAASQAKRKLAAARERGER